MTGKKRLPRAFAVGFAVGTVFVIGIACLTLLIKVGSGTSRFFLFLGGLAVGGAMCGIVGAAIGFSAFGKQQKPSEPS